MMMNPQTSRFFPANRWLYAALLVLGLFTAAGASAAIEQRWLFIFDTSSDMKKRLPEVDTQIKTLFTKDFAGALHEGESIGVWTFDEKLHMGQFPLKDWDPKRVVLMASNLMTFLHKQSYSGTANFGVLQPTLDSVIEDSDRLTVVIICAGNGEILWTPYNDGLNETLKQTRDDRKKLKQPYVIVLRTQLGKYVGATVNFPPKAANLPPFPLLPAEIKAMAPPPPIVVVKPPPPAPPLVIVGTHVSSDTNDVLKYAVTNQPAVALEKSNPPAVMVSAPQNVVSALPATNVPGAKPVAVVALPVTNIPVAAVTNAVTTVPDDRDTRILTYVGVGLLGAAVALVIFLVVRGKSAPRSSLITSSMQGNPRPPEQK